MTEPKWRRNFLFPSQRFVESFDCELNLSKDLDVLKVRTIQSKERHSGLWDAAVVLGAYIFQHKQEFVGKSVIELGAGTGLPGIVASFVGSKLVIETELDEELVLLKENVDSNAELFSKAKAQVPLVRELYWGSQLQNEFKENQFDFIIGADVVYELQHFSLLFKTLNDLTQINSKATIILCIEHRWKDVEKYFWDGIRQEGFDFETVPHEKLHETYNHPKIDIYIITKRRLIVI